MYDHEEREGVFFFFFQEYKNKLNKTIPACGFLFSYFAFHKNLAVTQATGQI